MRSIKKMSCGHSSSRLTENKPALRKRPYSMVNVLPSQALSASSPRGNTHLRSNTLSGGKPPKHKPGRRGSRQKSPGSGNPSPLHAADEPRRRKKKDDKKRKQDREQKHTATKENLGSSTSLVNSSLSVSVHHEEERGEDHGIEKKVTLLGSSPTHSEVSDISSVIDVTASLHSTCNSLRDARFLRRSNSLLLANDAEMRRVRSDAHLLNGREERHHVCPPERKQFYRQILRRINTGARHRIEPSQSSIHHVSRLRSENLALDNPFGPMWEQIWREIQVYLGDMKEEEYDHFKYKIGEQIEVLISKISRFKVGSFSPLKEEEPSSSSTGDHPKPHASKDTITAVAKKLTFHLADSADSADLSSGRESSAGTIIADGHDSSLTGCGDNIGRGRAVSTDNREAGHGPLSGDDVDICASLTPSAIPASAGPCKSTKNKYCFDQFLSEPQLSALDEVDKLLNEFYTLESRYPNRKRLGHEHPHYNELQFKVHHLALILWFKVTTSLADKLCTLSVWLEVPVVVPDLCRDVGRDACGHMTVREVGELLSPEASPKSPRVTKGFILGTSDSGSEHTPTSSLKKSHGFHRSNALDVTASLLGQNIDVTKSLVSSSIMDQNVGPYRSFVNRGLKRKGLTYTVEVKCTLYGVCIDL